MRLSVTAPPREDGHLDRPLYRTRRDGNPGTLTVLYHSFVALIISHTVPTRKAVHSAGWKRADASHVEVIAKLGIEASSSHFLLSCPYEIVRNTPGMAAGAFHRPRATFGRDPSFRGIQRNFANNPNNAQLKTKSRAVYIHGKSKRLETIDRM